MVSVAARLPARAPVASAPPGASPSAAAPARSCGCSGSCSHDAFLAKEARAMFAPRVAPSKPNAESAALQFFAARHATIKVADTLSREKVELVPREPGKI